MPTLHSPSSGKDDLLASSIEKSSMEETTSVPGDLSHVCCLAVRCEGKFPTKLLEMVSFLLIIYMWEKQPFSWPFSRLSVAAVL